MLKCIDMLETYIFSDEQTVLRSSIQSSVPCCEHCNEFLGFIK